MASIGLGISRIEPEKSDRRFSHPAWRGHPGYRRLGQAYLAWSRSVNGLADRLETPDWRTREQLRFVFDLCTSAAAPTNCLLGNQHWADRVTERAGAERPAPKIAGRKRHGELEPAPGRYIHE
ncbi:hypothetical protein [Pseudomonas sp. GM21]|uniref:hypothetical protein n=1 Tax=Pseudomonas sp. GM21 TaxID=1144325 RepID=UPI0009DA7A0E